MHGWFLELNPAGRALRADVPTPCHQSLWEHNIQSSFSSSASLLYKRLRDITSKGRFSGKKPCAKKGLPCGRVGQEHRGKALKKSNTYNGSQIKNGE